MDLCTELLLERPRADRQCCRLSIVLPQFDDFSRDLCVQALLDIMDMFCDRLR